MVEQGIVNDIAYFCDLTESLYSYVLNIYYYPGGYGTGDSSEI